MCCMQQPSEPLTIILKIAARSADKEVGSADRLNLFGGSGQEITVEIKGSADD